MGNEHTQTQDEAAVESRPFFGDPLDWPDAMAWERFLEGNLPTEAVSVPEDFGVDELFDSVWRPDAEPAPPPAPKTGDGDQPTDLQFEHLDESLWSTDEDDTAWERESVVIGALGGASTVAASGGFPVPPAAVAETAAIGRGPGRSWWPPRIDVRHGPAAVIALASCVSLILVGMFLSVRARDDLADKTAEFQTSGRLTTESSTSVPRSTIPPTTIAQAPPSSITLSDLIPADAVTTGGDTVSTSTPTSTPVTSRAPATTAAPARTTPTAQPTNTTVAADPEPTSPAPTSPPANDTTTSSRPRTSTSISIPDFTIPDIPQMSTPTPTSRLPFSSFNSN